jgi:xanthosine utilization system XapX-like protein
MTIGATIQIPISIHRVGRVCSGAPSALAVLVGLVGMIEALMAMQRIMTILAADLARWP